MISNTESHKNLICLSEASYQILGIRLLEICENNGQLKQGHYLYKQKLAECKFQLPHSAKEQTGV